MKKRAMSLALALVMCLGLTVPAFAVGETTVKDEMGLEYTLSNPVLGTETYQADAMLSIYSRQNTVTVYLVPEGTVIKPVKFGSVPVDEARKMSEETSGSDYGLYYEIYDINGEGGDELEEEGFALTWPGVQPVVSRLYWEVSLQTDPNSPIHGNGASSGWTSGAICFKVAEGAPAPGTPTQPEQPSAPVVTVEDIPASGTAYASTQTVTVDGKAVEFQMYALKDANGNGTNYVKLRDLAYVLNGTEAQFSVGYDGTISLTSGQPYTAAGGEMTTPFSGDRTYSNGTQSVKIDGDPVEMTAITLLDDAGGGYNYFKLRDLGKALGFHVGWSAETGVIVETGRPYAG